MSLPLKTVVVLGAAYGGAHAAQVLAAGLPDNWRIVLVDRNTHTNHIYVFPRFAVLPGHEHKGFIPNTNVFLIKRPLDLRLHASVLAIAPNSATLSRAFPEHGMHTTTLRFDYAVYALGSRLPSPVDLWGAGSEDDSPASACAVAYTGTKAGGIAWLGARQRLVRDAETVLVVGGGALGIQFATDVADVYPSKSVTLLHSRDRLLPRFDEAMHTEIVREVDAFPNITVILGERLDMSTQRRNERGQQVVKTTKGRELVADLILLCTGQKPNTEMLRAMDPRTVNPGNGLARVSRTMQLSVAPRDSEAARENNENNSNKAETTPYPNIFVIGDAADAFGAVPAGHNAYFQAEVAARNILRLVRRREGETGEALELYTTARPAIKVSLGLRKSVHQSQGVVGTSDDGKDDLDAGLMWPFFGAKVEKDEDMEA